jgi:hypothetical protein
VHRIRWRSFFLCGEIRTGSRGLNVLLRGKMLLLLCHSCGSFCSLAIGFLKGLCILIRVGRNASGIGKFRLMNWCRRRSRSHGSWGPVPSGIHWHRGSSPLSGQSRSLVRCQVFCFLDIVVTHPFVQSELMISNNRGNENEEVESSSSKQHQALHLLVQQALYQ